MTTLPLSLKDGHLFVEMEGGRWLFDTGAPTSFGDAQSIAVAGERFTISSSYMGLSATTLSRFVGVDCIGLLGADILGCFDHIIDCSNGALTISTAELPHSGQSVHLDEFMGIPIVTARIGGSDYRMFFDTGAQVSYFQDESLATYPVVGTIVDFYPGVGQFQTETHEVPVSLGEVAFALRCGTLPSVLGMTLMMAGTAGIVGNAILASRTVGYFPRRKALCL